MDLVPNGRRLILHTRICKKNLLWFISKRKSGKDDVMDLLYQEIKKNIVDRRRALVYAPYIQAFIEHVTTNYYTAGPGVKNMVITNLLLRSQSKV